MKKFILILITILLATNNLIFADDKSECDKITGTLKKGKKIDCLIAIKAKKTKELIKKDNAAISEKLQRIENKKKKFDEKNKTLWDMYKNLKK